MRTCQICNRGDIEDEFHFLMICPKYNTLRQILFERLQIEIDKFLSVDALKCLFLKRIATKLASKWHSHYSVVMGFMRARLSLAIVRATTMCLRGSRKTMSGIRFDLEDGAGVCLHF